MVSSCTLHAPRSRVQARAQSIPPHPAVCVCVFSSWPWQPQAAKRSSPNQAFFPSLLPSLLLYLPPQDLEGIVDTFSDDEGDKAAQDSYINDENAAGDRRELKEMVRRVREGFGEERGGGRGRGGNARGNLRLDELTRADKSTRGEARRLGLLNRWVAACCCCCCIIRCTRPFRPCQRSSSCSSRGAVVSRRQVCFDGSSWSPARAWACRFPYFRTFLCWGGCGACTMVRRSVGEEVHPETRSVPNFF